MNSPPFSFFKVRFKKRTGVSPVIGSVIILAITVSLGLALWSNVNSNVNTSTVSFTNTITGYVNYITDRFEPVNAAFALDTTQFQACKAPLVTADCTTLWVYNYGSKTVQINTVTVMKTTNSASMKTFDFSTRVPPVTIAPNTLGNVTVAYGKTTGFLHNSTSYTFQVVTNNGVLQSYYQVDTG